MSRFRRMVVIPQEEYAQLLGMRRLTQPLAMHYDTLHRQFEEQAKIEDPYSRLVHQSESLEQMKALKDQMRQSLLVSTPKVYRSRAETLMKVIEPHIGVSSRGELLNKASRQPIEDSRLDDLIQHAVRDRRRQFFSPKGWSEFVQTMREINVPRQVLNRQTIEELDIRRALKREATSPVVSPVTKKQVPTSLKQERKKRRAKRSNVRYPKTDYLLTY